MWLSLLVMLIVLSDFLLPENVTPQALLEEFEQCDLVPT